MKIGLDNIGEDNYFTKTTTYKNTEGLNRIA
jgi:hypothetical protein